MSEVNNCCDHEYESGCECCMQECECDTDNLCDECYESTRVYPESWGEIVLERALDNGEL